MARSLLPLAAVCAQVVVAAANAPSDITRCTTGAANITRKAFAVQICNLFGGTCFVNHPAIASADCGTQALEIASGTCKLYPIFEYQDNGVRSGSSAVEELSTVGDLGCSVSLSVSNGVATGKYSGACVSVQCATSATSHVGPKMTQSSSSTTSTSRTTGVTDTAAATFETMELASLPSAAKQLKNVFLVRTGMAVAVTSKAATSSNGFTVKVGKLPTSDGNNYGPTACPSRNNLLSSTTATAISAQDLRRCGATGKWVYWNAVNLLMDQTRRAQYADSSGGNAQDFGGLAFLEGKSLYRSGTNMATAQKVILREGNSVSANAMMTSDVVTPQVDFTGEVAGTWRSYAVVFYCTDYARADLTNCAASNRAMLYVADPNPDAQFGTAASAIQGGGSGGGTTSAAAPRHRGAQGAAWALVAGALAMLGALR